MNTGGGSFRALARASALLDVARDCFVDAFVGGYSENDRSLAQRHLSALNEQDLLVMDRGYPSRALFAQLAQQDVKFCARLSHSWSETKRVLRGTVADQVCEFGSAEASLPLRILRHALPNGTVLVLITNVMDAGITPDDFAAQYRGRWRIEECFKLIKARLQVENWSGVLPHTVEQDFYASLVRANCAAALALEADPAHACLLPATPDDKGLALGTELHAGNQESASRLAAAVAEYRCRRAYCPATGQLTQARGQRANTGRTAGATPAT